MNRMGQLQLISHFISGLVHFIDRYSALAVKCGKIMAIMQGNCSLKELLRDIAQ